MYKVDNNKVVEKDTDLIVYTSDLIDDVVSVCKKLNLGGGFAGFTPTFFCERYQQKSRQTS